MGSRGWLILVVVLIALGAAADLGRRLALSRSLYRLNLQAGPALAIMSPPASGQRVLIIAPHPDDEALGASGLIQQARAAGAELYVALVTNGEYPELSAMVFEETLSPRPADYIKLGYRRQAESVAALASLGVESGHIVALGYPNQYLQQMWLATHWRTTEAVRSKRTGMAESPYTNSRTPRAPNCGEAVLQDFEGLLEQVQPDVLIAVNPHDHHPDHWPTYGFVRLALEDLRLRGEGFAQSCRMYTYLVHRDQWPVPGGYRPWLSLDPPAALDVLDDTRWEALPLTLGETIAKRRAIELYRTQAGPVDPLLRSFARSNELFGEVAARPWAEGDVVAATTVLFDPVGDVGQATLHPRADIYKVDLSRRGGQMCLQVSTRRPGSRRTHYWATIHVVTGSQEGRLCAVYRWQGKAAKVTVLEKDDLRAINASELSVSLQKNTSQLTAPCPLPTSGPAAFTIRAWTVDGRRIVDETTVATYRIGGARNQATASRAGRQLQALPGGDASARPAADRPAGQP